MSAEIHRPCVVTTIAPHVIIDGPEIIAVCTNAHHAARLAHLWDTYGAVDVPDTLEGLTP